MVCLKSLSNNNECLRPLYPVHLHDVTYSQTYTHRYNQTHICMYFLCNHACFLNGLLCPVSFFVFGSQYSLINLFSFSFLSLCCYGYYIGIPKKAWEECRDAQLIVTKQLQKVSLLKAISMRIDILHKILQIKCTEIVN